MAAGAPGERTLKDTPSWAVAVVCAVIIIISVIIEHGIHSLEKWFKKQRKKAMMEALEKIKAELMLLGFISLILTVGTSYIAKICIPPKYADIMLPCRKDIKKDYYDGGDHDDDDHKRGDDRRKLLSYIADEVIWRRALAAPAGDKKTCSTQGKVELITYYGAHQLHIFIFVLAVFHVIYSVMTIALGKSKMKKWKSWELETASLEYQFTNDPARFRFTHQTSFVKRHSGASRTPVIRWIVAFFRQFFGSVTKVDYLTLRRGFINKHFAANSKFDFRQYIKRSMEDDFKVVVGVSIPLWIFAIIFLLLNVYDWYTMTWLSLAPLITLLLVGTKLELIIMEMAEEIQDRTTVVKGAPVVEPSNKYFWFNRPDWVLLLIHFILFQMGSHMKRSIFEEQTAKALMKWQKAAKERKKLKKAGADIGSSSGFMSGDNTPSQGAYPLHLLHNNKHRSIPSDIESVHYSPRSYQSDTELSEIEDSNHDDHNRSTSPPPHQIQFNQPQRDEDIHSHDFSFVKP